MSGSGRSSSNSGGSIGGGGGSKCFTVTVLSTAIYTSALAENLEFHPARGAFGPSPKFIFKYVTRTPPKLDLILFQPE
jgi:hypothetical protein